jgi:hypothetical protein
MQNFYFYAFYFIYLFILFFRAGLTNTRALMHACCYLHKANANYMNKLQEGKVRLPGLGGDG